MSIFKPILQDIVESDIHQLISDAQQEGLRVEFKRDMYGNADADKKEFLKDLSAFANSSGGQLIIGIDEQQGAANAVSPILGDPDVGLQRLEQLARSGLEPRIVGLQSHAVPMGGDGFVYILRVPRSWNPPHRVNLQNTNRFYLRSSAGAHEASVEELRAAFANGADMRDRMNAYIADRVQKIADNEGIVFLSSGDGTEGRLALHVLPFLAFAVGTNVDVGAAQNVDQLLQPIGSTGSSRINFDGIMVVRGAQVPHGYTQVFRNGVIEATKVRAMASHPQHGMRIPMRTFVEQIYQRLPQYLRALQALDVPPPFGVSISLIEIEGAHLGIDNNPWELDYQNPIDRPTLVLPMQVIGDFGSDGSYRTAIRPAIDALFNAAGIASADSFLASFGDEGIWKG